jgi:hypothetical protein
MANLDLAAPNTAILHTIRFSCLFAGLRAQLQPVAEIVQCTEPLNRAPRSFVTLGLFVVEAHRRVFTRPYRFRVQPEEPLIS